MKPDDLETNLQSLSKYDLFIVLWYVRLRWLHHKISLLRPRHVLIPATAAQIIVFAIAALNPQTFLFTITVGNLIIVGIAIYPSTLKRSAKMRWIK